MIGLGKQDILEYLDDEICRQSSPLFPGWTAAIAAWKATDRRLEVKEFITETFGLHLDSDAVRRLAAERRLAGRIPTEFKRVVRSIAAATTSQLE